MYNVPSRTLPPNDKAVSAVISVVLMVAITVILAAAVASLVLGMTKNIPDSKIVTSTVTHVDAGHVTVTYQGGQDAATCTGVRYVLTKDDGTGLSRFMMGSSLTSASHLVTGTTHTFSTNWAGKKRLLAIAYFSDNTQQIILDNTF
jgi:archaeal type IV pilus assembly protein PilA